MVIFVTPAVAVIIDDLRGRRAASRIADDEDKTRAAEA
jgi:hypothetical protein